METTIMNAIQLDHKMAYVIADRALRVVGTAGAVEIFGAERAEMLGRQLSELVPELVGLEDVLQDILTGARPRFRLDWVNRETEEGEIIYLTMVSSPYHDSNGEIVGLIHMVEDITEMGRISQQLTQQRNDLRLLQSQLDDQNQVLKAANAELQRLDEIKTVFVSVAAHELRTPLTTIQGYLEMLLDDEFGPLDEAQRVPLQVVHRSACRLGQITRNLLDVTHIEAGRIELVLKPTDLAVLVEGIVAEMRPQLDEKGQQLALTMSPRLPLALCDETRAAQVIGNLLSNANKYTPEGGVITVEVAPAVEEGFLQVTVADTGVGISQQDQAKLFQRFFRAGSAVETRTGGSGLGLYISRALVELHGGAIGFASELGQGSAFHVTFPIADAGLLSAP
jgi:PAS domain S-box-containing protein